MQITLTQEDVEMLRELLRQKILETDKEINRTDSLAFKSGLRQIDRSMERVLGELSAALEASHPAETTAAPSMSKGVQR
jgi:hypothetical protein